MKKPISIAVLGWFSIFAALVGALSLGNTRTTISLLGQPLGPVYHAITALIQVVSAVGILNGRAWGRLLYVGQMVFATVVAIINMSTSLIINTLPLVVAFDVGILFLLYRPSADAYFGHKSAIAKVEHD
jgi:hypothetical protein